MQAFKQFFLLILLLFPSCMQYRKQPSHSASLVTNQFSKQSESLRVSIRELSPNNGSWFTKKKIFTEYQPLEITIQNKSNHSFTTSNRNIQPVFVSPKKVAKKIHKNLLTSFLMPISSITPLKALGLVLWGVAYAIASESVDDSSDQDALGVLFAYGALTTTAAITNYDNKRINWRFKQYATDFSAPISIAPHSTVTKITYVQKSTYTPSFKIGLINSKTGELENFDFRN